nr:MAG TPA: repressor protein CI [Caudoviricetes sp.]
MSMNTATSYVSCSPSSGEAAGELFDYILKQVKISGMSRTKLARRLGASENAFFLWTRRRRIPINYVVQIAKLLGLDPIYLRNWALKEWAPELFQEDERLRQFADMTQNELEFLEIIRSAGKRNPKMNEEQKKQFAKFVAGLDGDGVTKFYDDQTRAGRPSTKKDE